MKDGGFMALTHVAMWNNGWKDITIEEAIKLHPGGLVSAKSGLFMCKLCHQNVMLTDGRIYRRYFKHERDNSKTLRCPDRSENIAYPVQNEYQSSATVPIKLIETRGKIRLQLGFYMLEGMDRNDIVTITPHTNSRYYNDNDLEISEYSLSRIPEKGIVYLDVDSTPATYYSLSFNSFNAKRKLFSTRIEGISEEGTIFDAHTGKKLPMDADVIANKEYYLLIRNQDLETLYDSMEISKICDLDYEWALYSVCALSFNEYAAKFFLEYGYVLTDTPARVIPLWPAYTESPYIINHNKETMYFFVQGNSVISKVFPSTNLFGFKCGEKAKVLQLDCNSRQQLLASGRDATMLRSTYLWKVGFAASQTQPELTIKDVSGALLDKDEYNCLPKDKIVQIKAEYDYKVVISVGEDIKNTLWGKANSTLEIDKNNLRLGETITVYIGNDCIRRIAFVRQASVKSSADDKQLIAMLNCVDGKTIVVPNELRNIAGRLEISSELRHWVIAAIRRGYIKQKAYSMIIDLVVRGGLRK